MAFRGDKRSGREARDSPGGGGRGERILPASRPESLARSPCAYRDGLEQTVPGDRAVADRGVRPAISDAGGRHAFTALLRDRVSWDRDGNTLYRHSHLWTSRVDPHA